MLDFELFTSGRLDFLPDFAPRENKQGLYRQNGTAPRGPHPAFIISVSKAAENDTVAGALLLIRLQVAVHLDKCLHRRV